jgi:aromatic ring-opening dioxygenase LigB subunit
MLGNPFVFACVTPHGLPILEELAGEDQALMSQTRASMQLLGQQMANANPETLIILTPHGLTIEGQFSVSDASFLSGTLSEQTVAAMVGEQRSDDGQSVHVLRSGDRTLARKIVDHAQSAHLPVGALNFATREGVFSQLPLDWGSIVPLSFMPDVPIVVITPSRRLSDEAHLAFGQALAEAVRESGNRVGLIASCDWSHAHSEQGPYGLHPDASTLDEKVLTLFRENRLEDMMNFSPTLIANAKPDGIWQTLILAGAIPLSARRSHVLSYEVPTYFGLMCVSYS